MRKVKMNRKNRRAKKLVVCTLLLALVTTGIPTQSMPSVYAEENYGDESDEDYKLGDPLNPYVDEQGIKYYTWDGKSFIAGGGDSVTKSDIIIPSKIVFEGKSHSVTNIDVGAFRKNGAIKTVKIDNGIETIGTSAFLECSNLQSVTIPNSVKEMGISIFSDCKKLRKVTLGKNLKKLEMTTFYGCSSLQSISIPGSVTNIGPGAFYGCGLKSVTIPNNVTQIEKSAFKKNSNLTKVVIGNKLKSIGSSAFEEDKKLKSITIKSQNLKSKSVGSKTLTKTNSKLVIKVPAKKVAAYQKLFKGKGNKTVKVKKM